MPLLTKDDLTTHLYAEIRDEITRGDDAIIDKAIANGESEAKSYLNRYDIATMFNVSFTDEYFRSIVKDLVCWHLIKLSNPNVDVALFRTSYDDAKKTLEKVMKGIIDPAWPLRTDDTGTPLDESGNVYWNSNTKRTNHY
jgi:hypothetical protein